MDDYLDWIEARMTFIWSWRMFFKARGDIDNEKLEFMRFQEQAAAQLHYCLYHKDKTAWKRHNEFWDNFNWEGENLGGKNT